MKSKQHQKVQERTIDHFQSESMKPQVINVVRRQNHSRKTKVRNISIIHLVLIFIIE